MRIDRSLGEPIRTGLDWPTLWNSEDDGLIACWERGRERAGEDPGLAARAHAGELPILPWKGGHERATKLGWRYGTLKYLAMWQGLRGDHLSIDMEQELTVTCSATGMRTVFTPDWRKFLDE